MNIEKTPDIATTDDLKSGQTVGVQKGTTGKAVGRGQPRAQGHPGPDLHERHGRVRRPRGGSARRGHQRRAVLDRRGDGPPLAQGGRAHRHRRALRDRDQPEERHAEARDRRGARGDDRGRDVQAAVHEVLPDAAAAAGVRAGRLVARCRDIRGVRATRTPRFPGEEEGELMQVARAPSRPGWAARSRGLDAAGRAGRLRPRSRARSSDSASRPSSCSRSARSASRSTTRVVAPPPQPGMHRRRHRSGLHRRRGRLPHHPGHPVDASSSWCSW